MENNILIEALKGNITERPPIWIMRQAGRYLKEFRKLKEKYSFFERCQNPQMATEITLMPIKTIQPDAAIIFSDILVIPKAMGIDIDIKNNIGPVINNPIKTPKDINFITLSNVEERLSYVFEALSLTKKELNNKIPLIGFAGSPWTIFCYIVGDRDKDFNNAKSFAFKYPKESHYILDKITLATIKYLKKKISHGTDVIQIFDSWGGILPYEQYFSYNSPYIDKIIDSIKHLAPTIVFVKDSWFALKHFSDKNVAISIGSRISPSYSRNSTNNNTTLQGNLDPSFLLTNPNVVKDKTIAMIKAFGIKNYIVNLGHGILPNTPMDNVRAFVDTVKSYR